MFPQLFSKTQPTTHILQEEATGQAWGGERGRKKKANLAKPLPFFSCSLSLYVTTVYFSVSSCYYKTPDSSDLRWEVFIWTHCWRLQYTMAEETRLPCKAADHSASAVRRPREINACFQNPHSFLCIPGPQPMVWHHPLLGVSI